MDETQQENLEQNETSEPTEEIVQASEDTPETINQDTEELTVEEVEYKEVQEYDYFAGLNRILTSILAGIIGAGILFGVAYFAAQVMQADLSKQEGLSIPFILLMIMSVFLSTFIAEIVQLYLYKLVEKDRYKNLGNKVFINLISQLVLLVLVLPFVFINFAKSGSALLSIFVLYQAFSLLIAAGIREKGLSDRLIGNQLGLFTSAALIISFISGADLNPLIAVVILPMMLVLEAFFDFASDVVVFWVNKD